MKFFLFALIILRLILISFIYIYKLQPFFYWTNNNAANWRPMVTIGVSLQKRASKNEFLTCVKITNIRDTQTQFIVKRLTTKNIAIKMGNGKEHACEKPKKKRKGNDKERQTDRTTMMLLAVLLLFLVTEMPQGILGLLSVILGPSFFNTCYVMLGEFKMNHK